MGKTTTRTKMPAAALRALRALLALVLVVGLLPVLPVARGAAWADALPTENALFVEGVSYADDLSAATVTYRLELAQATTGTTKLSAPRLYLSNAGYAYSTATAFSSDDLEIAAAYSDRAIITGPKGTASGSFAKVPAGTYRFTATYVLSDAGVEPYFGFNLGQMTSYSKVTGGYFSLVDSAGEDLVAHTTAVSVSPGSVELAIGGTTQLAAALTPADSTNLIYWSSSDDSVATVSADGTVTGVSKGTCTVTATSAGVTGTCDVLVYAHDTHVASAADLVAVSEAVAAGDDYSYSIVTLDADVDLSGISWTPIGTSATPFRGTFHGNGHTVSNSAAPVFGYAEGATLEGVTTGGATVTANLANVSGALVAIATDCAISDCVNRCAVKTDGSRAGIAGSAEGSTITGCANYGDISWSTIWGYSAGICNGTATVSCCANFGAVSSGSRTAGIGGSVISSCANYGAVSCSSGYAAGIAYSAETVTGCLNQGSVTATRNNSDTGYLAAGICLTATGAGVSGCYNAGKVSSASSGTWDLSIKVGNFPICMTGTVQDSYYLEGCFAVAAPEGYEFSGSLCTAEWLSGADAVAALGGEFATDDAGINRGYPVLSWQQGSDFPETTLSLVAGTGGAVRVTQNGQELASGATVRLNSVVSVEAVPAEGYALSRMSATGMDQLSDGTWAITSASGASVTAAFKAAPTGDYDWASTTWAGGLDFSWYDESDVKGEYHITTPAQWEALAWICSEHLSQLVADDGSNSIGQGSYTAGNVTAIRGTVPTSQNLFEGVQFYLDCDIDMGGVYDADSETWSGPNYYPVGSQAMDDSLESNWYGLFFGSFDGQGHIISNIYCDRVQADAAAAASGCQSVGLFGRVGDTDEGIGGGCDADITIQNVAVSGYIHGYRATGGIVGKTLHVAEGHTITVSGCLNFIDMWEYNGAKGIGGVVGTAWNGCVIQACANFGSVSGNYTTANAAGVAGSSEAALVSSCYNVGLVENPMKEDNCGAVALNQASGLPVLNCWALAGSCPGYASSIVNRNANDTGTTTGGWASDAEMRSAAFAATLNASGALWATPSTSDPIYALLQSAGCEGYPVPVAFTGNDAPEGAEVPATAVELSANQLDVALGYSRQLDATLVPLNSTDDIAWSTSDSSVARVSSDGTVYGVGEGTCTITCAAASGVSALCEVTVAVDERLHGGEVIAEGGTYQLAPDFTGTVIILTSEPVELVGQGLDVELLNVNIDCTDQATHLTLRDVYAHNLTSTGNMVDFANGSTENTLVLAGTCMLDLDTGATGYAMVHVPDGSGLTVSTEQGCASYIYKREQGAGFGGNGGAAGSDGQGPETNGSLTFDGANLFMKNSKQGALIGAGAMAGTQQPGPIAILNSELNLIAVSRGAAIGGSAGSSGASSGSTVTIENSLVNVNVDFSGAAVGGGGFDAGNDSDGGTLVYQGGSLRAYLDMNAIDLDGDGDTSDSLWPDATAPGVNNNAAVTARVVNGDGEPLYLCVVDTALAASQPEDGRHTVMAGSGETLYEGALHGWAYVNEALSKADQVSVADTRDNWVAGTDSCLYVYLDWQP